MLRSFLFCLSLISLSSFGHAGVVTFQDNQLLIDGVAQPQLYGAEIQYFRLRGGEGRNVPREKVLELWNRVLDQARQAQMNTISFYIPWDFHEYAEGKFDFDGTVDEDGDGRPDYPSRDVRTFLRLVQEHGFTRIMARPGPYINAEWGFLGFGAIPLWFHEKYPDSHAMSSKGQRTTLYSYHDPRFLEASTRWLQKVYQEVLKEWIGPGKPIHFVQLDNETNYMWQSLYNLDYSPLALQKYREFLFSRYGSLEKVNQAHLRNYQAWNQIQAPVAMGLNLGEDQDWYRFHDVTIHKYLQQIRGIWENMGVQEPQVLFTLAESFNAAGEGLLPNYLYRNDPGKTGMLTVNLYPKTSGSAFDPLFNQPFKSDLDVKSADSATDHYLGEKQEWVLGPEIQGGWWPGTEVSEQARRQTYLTTLGHGLKALFVYYFHEGNNWQWDWGKEQITPAYLALKSSPAYQEIPEALLPTEFWKQLNAQVQDQFFAGWDSKSIWQGLGLYGSMLRFDAPLGPQAEARAPFELIKEFGNKVVAPYGKFLGAAVELEDPVCLVKDVEENVPTAAGGLWSAQVQSDWAGGLVAYLMQSGINPKIIHWGLKAQAPFSSCKLLVYQDTGLTSNALAEAFRDHLAHGGALLSFLQNKLGRTLFPSPLYERNCGRLPTFAFPMTGAICWMPNDAGKWGVHYHVNEPIYANLNSAEYSTLSDLPARKSLIEKVLADLKIQPVLRVDGADRIVAFARSNPARTRLWLTVKNGQAVEQTVRVQWSEAGIHQYYEIHNAFTQERVVISGVALRNVGFEVKLGKYGSTAFYIDPYRYRDEKEGK